MDKNVLEFKSVQASAFRILIEALKEILTDANFECDETGIKMIAMDSSRTVLVHLKLNADKFESYICKEKRVLGISMINLFRIIKTMNNNDTFTLFLEREKDSVLGIKIENSEKNTTSTFHLNLMDLDVDNIQIPSVEFESVITMPSTDFQKIIRDMHNYADLIDIKSVEDHLIFSCKGDFCSQETIIGETDDGMNFAKNKKPDEIIQGEFALKHLVLFGKCTNLCNSIQMFLKNDYPLVIKYTVASLGEIKLCLAPSCNDEI
jgi:proliferating cell nuclear antigen|uniref:Proliferating cell nuclear antigen PCNA N-terminal domain-containing protein n=1 Tax=viral metagenome TaxID=1070528 RepID=A0A6C0J794_9ZZZZ